MKNFLRSLLPNSIPLQIDQNDILAVSRERILHTFLIFAAVLGAAIYLLIIPPMISPEKMGLIFLYTFCYLFLVVVAVLRRLPFFIRSLFSIFVLFALAFSTLISNGLSGNGPLYFIAMILLAQILLGSKFGFLTLFISLGSFGAVGYLMTIGQIPPPPPEVQANSGKVIEWASRTLVVIFVTSVFGVSLSRLVNGLQITIREQRLLSVQLQQEKDELELRVRERTQQLERRAVGLETAGQISRDVSSESDLDDLLVRAVELIKQEYGLYYSAVFLVDEREEFAALRAGTGEAGKVMLERNHRLPLGETSMVGFAISKKEYRLSQDVEEDPIHHKNPVLPETRTELALPLIINGKAIGAIDVQSTQPRYFQPDDIRILQIVADQLAVAIEKAQLVLRLTQTLNDLKTSYRQNTQANWGTFLKTVRKNYAYRYQQGTFMTSVNPGVEANQALTLGKPVITRTPATNDAAAKTVVAIPIVLRDHVLGVIDLSFNSENVPLDTLELLNSASNRLALALDNARLLEEIQLRAERDRLVSSISAKVRSETDVDHVLRTVALELGRSLGVSDVLVQLRGAE